MAGQQASLWTQFLQQRWRRGLCHSHAQSLRSEFSSFNQEQVFRCLSSKNQVSNSALWIINWLLFKGIFVRRVDSPDQTLILNWPTTLWQFTVIHFHAYWGIRAYPLFKGQISVCKSSMESGDLLTFLAATVAYNMWQLRNTYYNTGGPAASQFQLAPITSKRRLIRS